MPSVTVTLPTLVANAAGWRTRTIEATTLAEVLRTLRVEDPVVAALIFNEAGQPRQHVLIFHNDTATRWLEDLNVSVVDGDRVDVVQAISGG